MVNFLPGRPSFDSRPDKCFDILSYHSNRRGLHARGSVLGCLNIYLKTDIIAWPLKGRNQKVYILTLASEGVCKEQVNWSQIEPLVKQNKNSN